MVLKTTKQPTSPQSQPESAGEAGLKTVADNVCAKGKGKVAETAFETDDSGYDTDIKDDDSDDWGSVQEGRKKRANLYIDDIAKGCESVKISLVDEQWNGNRNRPKFFYIKENIIYQKANVKVSWAQISDEDCCSSCSRDCLSSSVPCGCTRVTDGEFAYTSDGLLKSKFLTDYNSREVYCKDCPMERATNPKKPGKCKGHPFRQFIKECWIKCGCNRQCGNRVVQRGISRKLQVFWTSGGKGWGLRTTEDLPMGAFVCEYIGEVVTNAELDERNRKSKGNEGHTYPVNLDADWISERELDDDSALCLDATNCGNVARFINHRCSDATMIDIPVEVERVDHHYYHVAFFTKREVKAYEELSWDYGIDFDDKNHPIKAFQCRCGSTECRDKRRKGSQKRPRGANISDASMTDNKVQKTSTRSTMSVASFDVQVRDSFRCYLSIPKHFANYIRGRFVKVQVEGGREWLLRWCIKNDLCGKFYGEEWYTFYDNNKWLTGDKYRFELMSYEEHDYPLLLKASNIE